MPYPLISTVVVVILGAIVGSFLNVVVYRLPRGLSVSEPRWSFCPHCRHPIRPHHNVPIVGWLWLRGRCNHCGTHIAALYPLTECACAMLFLLTLDALFSARTMPAISHISGDWPIGLAYLVMFAALLASAIMDIESYTIDIRVLIVVMVAGFVGRAIWGSPSLGPGPIEGVELPPGICLAGAAAGAVWLLSQAVALRRRPATPENSSGESSPSSESSNIPPTAYDDPSERPFQPLPIVVLFVVLMALIAWIGLAPEWPAEARIPGYAMRALAGGFLFMIMLVMASLVHRDSDESVIEEIDRGRASARGLAVREMASLLPALAAGVVVFVLLRSRGRLASDWVATLGMTKAAPGVSMLAGAMESVGSMMACTALGWLVRITGTLAFGKEAFATGDIYILAAMGAVAGFWPVFFAFFLASVLGLLGVMVILFRKKSRAIPFGPWLALGMYVSLWIQGPLMTLFGPAGMLLRRVILGSPEL